jgi:hypothetical protein
VPFSLDCTATATASTIRAEGIRELVGDVLINCFGGTPTAFDAIVPQVNAGAEGHFQGFQVPSVLFAPGFERFL